MRMRICLLMIVALASTSNVALAFKIRGSLIANGGTSSAPATNGVYRAFGSAGQPGIQLAQNASNRGCTGFWCFGGSRVLATDPGGIASFPVEFALGPAVPNPSGGETQFDLALPRAALVTLTVYDVSGRSIGEPVSRRFSAGQHSLHWQAPQEVRAGMYFLRLATDGVVKAKRSIVLMR